MRPPRALQDGRLAPLSTSTYLRDRTLGCHGSIHGIPVNVIPGKLHTAHGHVPARRDEYIQGPYLELSWKKIPVMQILVPEMLDDIQPAGRRHSPTVSFLKEEQAAKLCTEKPAAEVAEGSAVDNDRSTLLPQNDVIVIEHRATAG